MSLQSQLLKEGTRHMAGVDEAVLKNIEAVREMSKITRTSLGPQGMYFIVRHHVLDNWRLCSAGLAQEIDCLVD